MEWVRHSQAVRKWGNAERDGEKEWRSWNERVNHGLFPFHPLTLSLLCTAGLRCVCAYGCVCVSVYWHTCGFSLHGSHMLHGAHVHLLLCGPHSFLYVMFERVAQRRKLQQLSHQLRKLKERPANRSEAGLSLWAFPGGDFWDSRRTFRVLLSRQGVNERPCKWDCWC